MSDSGEIGLIGNDADDEGAGRPSAGVLKPPAGQGDVKQPNTLPELARTSKTGDERLDLRRSLTSDQDLCDISVADTRAHERFLDFVRHMQAFGSLFPDRLKALACAAAGQGLDDDGPPVIGIAQRLPETFSLVTLGLYLAEDRSAPISVVEVRPGTVRSDMPVLLASVLKAEWDGGRLNGEIVVIALPANIPTRELEAATLRADDALSLFLREAQKRAIIGFRLTDNQQYSRLVNGDTRIMPMPWASPFLHAIATRNEFSPTRLDADLVMLTEKKTAWFGPTNDEAEWQRSRQLAGLAAIRNSTPGEIQAKLHGMLAIESYDTRAGWNRSAAWLDEAFGLVAADAEGLAFPQGSRAIRQALLFTTAFCSALPGRYFMALVRANLDGTATVAFSEMQKSERDALLDLAGLSGEEQRRLPPTPLLLDYFRKHMDRLCREYDIVSDELGNMLPGESWGGFAIGAHIGKHAPVAAADHANRLLDNLEGIDFDIFLEQNTVMDMLASLRHFLASGFDDGRLVAWLCRRAVAAHVLDLAKSVATSSGPPLGPNGSHNSANLETAWRISETITQFLLLLRDRAAVGGTRLSRARQEDRLVEAVLHWQNWQPAFRAAFSLGVIFQDHHTPAATYEYLFRNIGGLASGRGRDFTFLRQTLSVFLRRADARDGNDVSGAARALRVFEFLDALGKTKPTSLRPLQDYFIEHILNFDIRWPQGNARLMSYQEINIRPLTAHIMATASSPDSEAGNSLVETMLFAEFFAVPPSEWLARSADGIAATEADRRLLDTLFVLLDGVPENARKWKSEDKDAHLARLAQALCAQCNVNEIMDTADYVASVRAIPADGSHTEKQQSLLELYGLFQPAVLLHWRFNLFGVDTLAAGSPESEALKAFLGRLVKAIPATRVKRLARGLKVMEQATHEALTMWAASLGDRNAQAFYAAKEMAIRRMRLSLLAQAELA